MRSEKGWGEVKSERRGEGEREELVYRRESRED